MFFLFNRKENEVVYIVKAMILSLLLTIPLVELRYIFFPEAYTVDITLTPFMILIATLLGPIFETLVMIVILEFIRYFTNRFLLGCIISAFVWGIIHSSNGSLHGVLVFPGFLIYSIAYEVWKKTSGFKGFSIVAIMHILHNTLVVLLMKFAN